MNTLEQFESLNIHQIKALEARGWDTVSVATADLRQLTAVPGIGIATARKAQAEAQKEVNQAKLYESAQAGTSQPQQKAPASSPASVRVQRIRDAHARGELI